MSDTSAYAAGTLDTFVGGSWDGTIAVALNAVEAYDGPINPTSITVLGQTFPDTNATSNIQIASGTLYLTAMQLPKNLTIKNFSVIISTQSTNDITNAWMGLFDTAYKVVAVSNSKTSGQTPAAGNLWTLPVGQTVPAGGAATSYVTTRAGLYYFGIMAVVTTTQPTIDACLAVNANGRGAMVPYLAGASSTGQSTIPSVSTPVAQTTPSTAGKGILAYVS